MSYSLFISHSWSYSDSYDNLIKLLNARSYFSYKDYSVPKDDSIRISAATNAAYKEKLKEKIKDQMRFCNCILILAGVYASYSDSIDMEIEIAKELNKPIIAIEPRGSARTSKVVKDNADAVVNRSTASIVEAIRKYSI